MADGLIIALSLGLQTLLVCRCVLAGIWRRYPFFFGYIAYDLARMLLLAFLATTKHPAYATIFWLSELGASVLWFTIGWEIFRHTFPRNTALWQTAGTVVVIVLLSLAATFSFASERPGRLIIPDVERKAGVAVAVWLLSMVALARFYRLPMGQNVFGMTCAFGLKVSVSVMNFSALGMSASFFPFLRYVAPLSFLAALGILVWTMWSYMPNPSPSLAGEVASRETLIHWWHSWDRLRVTLRRALGL